jgi:hypothetical protein
MAEPGWIDVAGPAGDLKALTWGPPDAPIALCLHGFPETPYGWRKIAPRLAESGWRVVAPFMREHAGHFLRLEQPDKVAGLVLAFVGSPG